MINSSQIYSPYFLNRTYWFRICVSGRCSKLDAEQEFRYFIRLSSSERLAQHNLSMLRDIRLTRTSGRIGTKARNGGLCARTGVGKEIKGNDRERWLTIGPVIDNLHRPLTMSLLRNSVFSYCQLKVRQTVTRFDISTLLLFFLSLSLRLTTSKLFYFYFSFF